MLNFESNIKVIVKMSDGRFSTLKVDVYDVDDITTEDLHLGIWSKYNKQLKSLLEIL